MIISTKNAAYNTKVIFLHGLSSLSKFVSYFQHSAQWHVSRHINVIFELHSF